MGMAYIFWFDLAIVYMNGCVQMCELGGVWAQFLYIFKLLIRSSFTWNYGNWL